jgi:hypothetical protein
MTAHPAGPVSASSVMTCGDMASTAGHGPERQRAMTWNVARLGSAA